MTKSKNRLIVLAIIQLLIIMGLSLFLVFSSSPSPKTWIDEITSIDRLLANEYTGLAEKSIKKLSRKAETRLDWLQLIKRSYSIGSLNGDYSLFKATCSMAVRYYPSDKDIRAFYINGLLLEGEQKKAINQRERIVGREYNSLLAELNLIDYFHSEENQKGKTDNYYSLLKKQLALSHDPDFFYKMGEMLDLPPLIFNAAVLYKQEGNTEKCLEILENIDSTRISPESLGYLYYDSEEYNKAIHYLETQFENDERFHNQKWILNQMLGDLYFSKDRERASFYYEKALIAEPEGHDSWISYLNLSNSYFLSGQIKKSYYLIEKALSLYPDNKKVISAYVSRYKYEKPVYTEKLLYEFSRRIGDPEIDLIILTQFNQQLTQARFQAKLWDLYNRNPDNPVICEYILWYLIGINDREGIKVVLDRFYKKNKDTEWLLFYEAIMHSLENQYNEASQSLARYLDKFPESWTASYNLGIILLLDETRLEDALSRFKNAEKLVDRKQYDQQKIILSNIYFQKAQIFHLMGKNEESLNELEASLTNNPDNIRSLHLKNIIYSDL